MRLAPDSDGLLDAVQHLDLTQRSAYARILSKLYYGLKEPHDLLEDDWDYLFVLDAARLDLFERALDDIAPSLTSSLTTSTSLGSTTQEWGYNTFNDRDLSDVRYVTANPMYNHFGIPDLPDRFAKLIDASEEFEETFSEFGTVFPWEMSDLARREIDADPDAKWILHYLQPHQPFIAETSSGDPFPAYPHVEGHDTAWEQLESGEVTRAEVERAYYANHELVLAEVLWLLGELPAGKRVVITSDHGNVYGEYHGFYGHGAGMYLPGLVDVPYLELETGEHYAERPDQSEPAPPEKAVGSTVGERLEALGYAE